MRTRLRLSPENNVLNGAYPPNVEHIHIILDSANSAFTVTLPDVQLNEHREFIFYNNPSSGNGHNVTIVPVSGQLLIVRDTNHVLRPYDTVSFCADLKKTWLLTDVNSLEDDNGNIIVTGDIIVKQGKAIYFCALDGDITSEGTLRQMKNGNNIETARLEGGQWIT